MTLKELTVSQIGVQKVQFDCIGLKVTGCRAAYCVNRNKKRLSELQFNCTETKRNSSMQLKRYILGIFDLNHLLLIRPRSLISFLILSSSVFGSTFVISLLQKTRAPCTCSITSQVARTTEDIILKILSLHLTDRMVQLITISLSYYCGSLNLLYNLCTEFRAYVFSYVLQHLLFAKLPYLK